MPRNNPYFAEEAIPGPISTQPRWYWQYAPLARVRWRFWPPSPQPLQMSGGQTVHAPVSGRVGVGTYATQTPGQPASGAPRATEGLRAPSQADMTIGSAYPLPNY